MSKRSPAVTSLARIVLAATSLAVLAACTEPVATDYRVKYAVSAYPTTVVLGIHVAGSRVAFADDEEARFKTLVAGYLDRGHGPITVSAPGPTGPGARLPEGLAAVRAQLLAAGVPGSQINVAVTTAGSRDVVTVSYERYEATLPTCGDWTSSPSYNPYNDVSSNFGCAWQRDVGLMAADPADLVQRRQAGPSDGQNASRVIQKYRLGAPTWAVPNPPQAAGASSQPGASQ